jgi:voltage-gated potassium channel
MTPVTPPVPSSRRQFWTLGLFLLLRMTLSVSALLLAYFLIPTRSAGRSADWPWLTLELCVFGVVVAFQAPAIVKARYPILRAIEALAILVSLYLLIFARIYLSSSIGDPAAFNQPLDKITALYFTVTVLSTVGFGDIVAQVNSMRLLVTLQMLLNLVLLGLVFRLLTASARQGVARRRGQADLGETDRVED